MTLAEWWIQAAWPALSIWLTQGNAPSYLAVLVAATAAMFAFRSSKASRESADAATSQLRRLHESDERDRAEMRLEQANGVAIWYERPIGHDDYFSIWFSNASKLPVYEPVIEVALRDPGRSFMSLAVTHLSPGKTFTNEALNQSIADKRNDLPHFRGHGFQASAICLAFSDANGIRWKRNLMGKLARVREVCDETEYREELLDPRTGALLPVDYFEVERSWPTTEPSDDET